MPMPDPIKTIKEGVIEARETRRVVGRNFFREEWEQIFPEERFRRTFADVPEPPQP